MKDYELRPKYTKLLVSVDQRLSFRLQFFANQ